MQRREFIAASLAAGAMAATAQAQEDNGSEYAAPVERHDFKMKYAPHVGMFEHHAGKDPVDQINFMADAGFTAIEDNQMPNRPVAEQEAMASALARHNMTMGVFVATGDFKNVTFASSKPEVRDLYLQDMHKAVEVAKRVNATWCTVVPGRVDPGLQWDYQTVNVVENLKRCAEIVEPHGLVMVLEPLNAWRDHPGLFLTEIPQAYMICNMVDSPSCKILFDMYHQQITEGNIIPNIDYAWDQVAYFQVGDNPGRKEPTTGEMNYKNIFKHIHGKGFDGILGMEHGLSKDGIAGEKALIDAYVTCDSFEV